MTDSALGDGDGVLGGRRVDEEFVNCGMLRCPRCFSRILSLKGRLTRRSGRDALLSIPKTATGAAPSGEQADACDWSQTTHDWWWLVEDVNDLDNVALSLTLKSPQGDCRLALCSDCRCGPLGYQLDGEGQLWFASDLLRQQDAAFANDAEDFKMPDGMDMASLQAMIESGQATVAYKTVFEETRLGMMLQDAADGLGVEVAAFTEYEGEVGPAERSGKVKLGDKVVRVNGKSTIGCGFAEVLEMIIGAQRPVTLHWERQGIRPQEKARVAHTDWKPYPTEPLP
eukprot:scaffold12195_cov164-Isochrysis_galbana.AAC.2